jgi:ribosomal protein S17E
LQYYLAALFHDIGKLKFSLTDKNRRGPQKKCKFHHAGKGDSYLQDIYCNEYTDNLKVIRPAIGLHHKDIKQFKDFWSYADFVKEMEEIKNTLPESKPILAAVRKSDRAASSSSRTKSRPYPPSITPNYDSNKKNKNNKDEEDKSRIPPSQTIPPYWIIDRSYYKQATIPKEFDILNKCKRVPIPEGSNLLSNETILFREQIKEMFLSRCEAQQFAQDISLWSHVSLTAALASCYRSNPNKEIYLAVIGYPSISEWFFNVQQDKALKQICGRMALVLEQMYSCLGSVLEPNNLPIDCLLTRWNTGLVVIFPAEIKEIASEMLKRHSKTFGFAATMEHIRYAENENGYATLSLKDALAKAYSRWLKGPRDIAWAPDDKPGFYSKTCIYCEQDPCICAEAEKLGAFPWKYSFETNSLDSQGFDLNIPYYHFLPLRTMFCDIKIHGMDNFFSQENNFLTAGRTFEILKRIETYLFTLSKEACLAITPEIGRTLLVIDKEDTVDFLETLQAITELEFWAKTQLVLSVSMYSIAPKAPIRDVILTNYRKKPKQGIYFEGTKINLEMLQKIKEKLPSDFDHNKCAEVIASCGPNIIQARRKFYYIANKTKDDAWKEIIDLYCPKKDEPLANIMWPYQELSIFLKLLSKGDD